MAVERAGACIGERYWHRTNTLHESHNRPSTRGKLDLRLALITPTGSKYDSGDSILRYRLWQGFTLGQEELSTLDLML